MATPTLHLVLYEPEIPQNTGNVGRLAVALGLRLHVVHPIGFSMDEKAVRRAGLDYWKHVDLQEHADGAAFWRWAEGRRVVVFSSHGRALYTSVRYTPGTVLVFGRESVGLPPEIVEAQASARIPMTGPVRSLNLAAAVSVVTYQAMQSVQASVFSGEGG